ncbi:MobC family plasmid mobilization relaxosome protein [Mucilaginibacter sp. UR6-1]|uniref:MobC family plasmid mobilization relaxosome protein n=1 Tax=Mucilaginibacter sp. UR6-1 TaxID=1435643 RepID=UPI001E2B192E|nr:MobC family plasmid mobilization relaxosome protein [Mucilaginibacter sp. UR6-1]MCC8408621.1 MobC family plasmid mobilization relaxosome protein [Mucilaginibacter sp. UR6-1]
MARPKVSEEAKRKYKITVRLNSRERLRIEEAAKTTGVSTYRLVRDKLLKGKFPEPKIAKTDIGVYIELKRIGNNINQLAKHANTGKFSPDIRSTLSQLREQQQLILKLLLYDSGSKDR